jgi:hypothetical protein
MAIGQIGASVLVRPVFPLATCSLSVPSYHPDLLLIRAKDRTAVWPRGIFAAQRLHLVAADFRVEPAPLRSVCRPGRPAHLRHLGSLVDQSLQAPQRVFLVLLEAARLLGLEHHHAFLGDARHVVRAGAS